MKTRLTDVLVVVCVMIACLLIPATSFALKTWTSGERIKAPDLNANFAEVSTEASALITDAKVSSSAAIAHSKLATPALLPKAWAMVTCTTSCTVSADSKVASVSRSAAGNYSVTLDYTAANTNYAVLLTRATGANAGFCYYGSVSTTGFDVTCVSYSGSAEDSTFSVLVMDDN